MSKLKIIIADDHDLFRGGLVELLKKHDWIDVVASVPNGNDLMDVLKKITPDVILLDLVMPNMDGFEVLSEISKRESPLKAIVISMHDDGNYIAKCAKNGAYGYLLKNTDEEELLEAIQRVASGKKYYSPEIAEKMINKMATHEDDFKELSKKETEILKHISKGLTTKEIAEKLFISTRTVETHRANMLKKLEVKNTPELIKKAAALKLF